MTRQQGQSSKSTKGGGVRADPRGEPVFTSSPHFPFHFSPRVSICDPQTPSGPDSPNRHLARPLATYGCLCIHIYIYIEYLDQWLSIDGIWVGLGALWTPHERRKVSVRAAFAISSRFLREWAHATLGPKCAANLW